MGSALTATVATASRNQATCRSYQRPARFMPATNHSARRRPSPPTRRSARSITLSRGRGPAIVALDLGNHLAHLHRGHHAHAFRPCPDTPPGSWISAVAQMCGLM